MTAKCCQACLLSIFVSNILPANLFTKDYTWVMLNTNPVNIRDILRSHKKVLEGVKNKKRRVVVLNQDEPQVGIVSLDDLNKLEEIDKQERYQSSTKSLLEVATKVRRVIKEDLPRDLSTSFKKKRSKENTLDDFYRKIGFKLVPDLYKTK